MNGDLVFISRIELLNKRKHTYALYSDDIFLLEITEDALVRFAITRNKQFSKPEFAKIIEYNNMTKCLNQAYEYLKRRPHLKNELYRKLKNKKFDSKITKQTIEELQKRQYLDDREFISIFIQDHIRQCKSGPLLIKKKLLEKGAQKSEIDTLLDLLFTEDKQIEIATKLVNKKLRIIHEPNKQKVKQRLYQYIQGRGFSWPVIEQVFNMIDYEINL
jgi:regulatory protein